MGIRNSSLTRVKPLFDHIGIDESRLNQFFSLFSKKTPIIEQNSIVSIRYGENEIKIPPSKSLLIWMLQNVNCLTPITKYPPDKDSFTYKKRSKLFSSDQDILNEAIALINTTIPLPEKAWYIFEGHTHPDIYIETVDSIFIGEAKRTERDITTKTKWLKQRDQLIRHIDSKLDQPKNIYSFYLLDKDEYNKGYYPQRMEYYKSLDYFKLNLKHRNDQCIEQAINSFIGFIFWDDLAKWFEISFPDTINDVI